MPVRLAIQPELTAKALPLPEEGQGHRLTPAKSRLRSSMGLGRQRGRAHIIYHDVKSRQEGVHIDHRAAPYLGEERAMLQVDGTFRSTVSCQLTPSVQDLWSLILYLGRRSRSLWLEPAQSRQGVSAMPSSPKVIQRCVDSG